MGQPSRVLSPADMGAGGHRGVARESGVFRQPSGGPGRIGGSPLLCHPAELELRPYLPPTALCQ